MKAEAGQNAAGGLGFEQTWRESPAAPHEQAGDLQKVAQAEAAQGAEARERAEQRGEQIGLDGRDENAPASETPRASRGLPNGAVSSPSPRAMQATLPSRAG